MKILKIIIIIFSLLAIFAVTEEYLYSPISKVQMSLILGNNVKFSFKHVPLLYVSLSGECFDYYEYSFREDTHYKLNNSNLYDLLKADDATWHPCDSLDAIENEFVVSEIEKSINPHFRFIIKRCLISYSFVNDCRQLLVLDTVANRLFYVKQRGF